MTRIRIRINHEKHENHEERWVTQFPNLKIVSVMEIVNTTCASHCGGSCILRLHVEDGVIRRIETDSGEEPQLRACLKGRAYRQRVYAPDRLLYPLKRTGFRATRRVESTRHAPHGLAGERGEGKFTRISWDEALDTIASEIVRIRDSYGPASILHLSLAGDTHNVHTAYWMSRALALAGGFTETWGISSFAAGMYAQLASYGTTYTCNMRDDLVNSRLIILWGWNPAGTVGGVNTNWYLSQAREAGARIVVVDPRFTDSAGVYAHQWIPIRPGTDAAMLLAMAYVMIGEKLLDRRFLDAYTTGFDRFKDYVTGKEDHVPKTPAWAEAITGVPAAITENLARDYATIKPAALMAGIAPGRTAYGEQYHRAAITLAAMTGNVGVHGGDAAGRAWEAAVPFGGYPYRATRLQDAGNPLNNPVPSPPPGAPVDSRLRGNDRPLRDPPPGAPPGYRLSRIHRCDVADFIERGRAGGYMADCKLVAVTNCAFVSAFPNVNRIARAFRSKNLEFIFVQEQFMTPTAKLADIVLPTTTFLERNDFAAGVGLPFYGYVRKVIEPPGECKSQLEIASLLAARLGFSGFGEGMEEDWLKAMLKNSEIPDYDRFRESGIYRLKLAEPYVALKKQIEDPVGSPFPTPSGKIEIYSQQWADLRRPDLPAVPKYIESWESRNDPLAAKYPLQMISTHFKRRANAQFENIPWLRELEPQAVLINPADARSRGIADGETVLVFNDRGKVRIRARVTERIMPGVVEIPNGAWYDPGEDGVDRAGCANVLTRDAYSPGGAFPFNTCLVEVRKK
ncbi:MAG: molybdopterin-dependent oxidoreductase [Chloroflexi bacterium]|nr:molybdopterin-dependent oxidoreductase [Chloroflexota bacterium]